MHKANLYLFILSIFFIAACNNNTKEKEAVVLPLQAKEAALFNQLVYKSNGIADSFAMYAPEYELVFNPAAVNGNFAIIAKKKNTNQYGLAIRGTILEFSNAGFLNVVQDLNIFNMKNWEYADTIKNAKIASGSYTGLQNILSLRDSGLTIKEFIEQKIPAGSTLVVTGHSLGGNLAYPVAGYLIKELSKTKKINLQLITFGAPATGNAQFVKDMEEKFPAAERYAIDKDIAPAFPNIDRISDAAKMIGLDSALSTSILNFNGASATTKNLLDIGKMLLEKTNILDENNKYVQSEKHFRPLTVSSSSTTGSALSPDVLFSRAYQFHKIDTYAELLGGKGLN
jgi:triacylglycerol lipase